MFPNGNEKENPPNLMAYKRLVPTGRAVRILFLLLSAALTTAGIAWFRRRQCRRNFEIRQFFRRWI